MHIKIHTMYVKNATSALYLKASIIYTGECTYVTEFTSALQGPVAKNTNDHRTCIGISRCTSTINMDVQCVITPTHRGTS